MQQTPMTCSEEAEQLNAKVGSDAHHVYPGGNISWREYFLQESKESPDTRPYST